MDKPISFKTTGFSGDIIHQLAGIKHVCGEMNTKADIFVWLDRDGFLYEGAVHPYGGKMMNQYAFDFLKPLIEYQPYINSFQVWTGQEIHVDLDKHREVKINMPYGSLTRWQGYVYPDMITDLSKPWLFVPVDENLSRWYSAGLIFINRTSRYQNPYISYFFLNEYKYQDKINFVGLPEEHETFQKDWHMELPLLKYDNALELAQAIYSCKFFIGNQSMCYAIAEAMKVPRILEVCQFAPNVIIDGPNGYDFTKQEALIYLVNKLFNKQTLLC